MQVFVKAVIKIRCTSCGTRTAKEQLAIKCAHQTGLLLIWRGEEDVWGWGHIYHIVGQAMQPAISIYYIKMKSFNTNKIMTESQVREIKKENNEQTPCGVIFIHVSYT